MFSPFSDEIQKIVPNLKEIGDEILKIYNSNFKFELKNDNTPVTKADLLSEKLLVSLFKKYYPSYGIISEETPNLKDVYKKDKIWIIDPIDGTKDFINKTDEFSIMIALVNKNREPIIGIVYAPAIDKLYFAEKGKGSYLLEKNKLKKIKVNKNRDIKDYILIKSRNNHKEEKINISNQIKMGSCGLKFGYIAEGLADVCYYETSEMGIWDDCASDIILTEADGCVFDLNGNKPIYDLKSRKMKNGFIGISSDKYKNEILNNILSNKVL